MLAALFLYAAQERAPALGFERFELVPEASTIGFEGSSTLHDFTGKAGELGGELRADPRALGSTAGGTLWIGAASLDTGNGRRDGDMRENLRAASYKRIGFVLEGLSGALEGWSGRLDARGQFVIAGVERARSFPVRIEPAGAGFRARGEVRFPMSEHGIEPPSVLFIDVEDEVRVFFDVVLRPLEAARLPARVRAIEVRETGSAREDRHAVAHELLWSSGRGWVWQRAADPVWIVASGERVTRADVRAALDLGAPPPAERAFEELRRELVRLAGAGEEKHASERASIEAALRSAPAEGTAEIARTGDVLAIRLGELEWIRFEGLAGEEDFAPLCAGLEGLPAAVVARLHEVHGVPARAFVRTATPERTRELELRCEPPREGELPAWAVDLAGWTRAPARRP